jgi:hypothetical protein
MTTVGLPAFIAMKTLMLAILLGCSAAAQVANHEPGETLAHFRAVEKNAPVQWPGGGAKAECVEQIAHKDPGTCVVTAWSGKSYKFRHDVLVNIEANMRVSYAKAVETLEARYGKAVDRRRVFKLRDHEVILERAYWHAKAFGVWALDMSAVDEQGDSYRYVAVIVDADSEHPQEKVNAKF